MKRLIGFLARIQAAWHQLRFHNVEWKAMDGCDILCHTCQLVIWCRALEHD
jgi:hypothetical protein